jgi:hypothetical protein
VFTSKVKGAAKERKFAFAGIASKRPKFPIYALVLGDDGQPTGETMFFTENVIPKINASA